MMQASSRRRFLVQANALSAAAAVCRTAVAAGQFLKRCRSPQTEIMKPLVASYECQHREWLGRVGVKTLFIEPGSPWENGYVESFYRLAPGRTAGAGSVRHAARGHGAADQLHCSIWSQQ